MTDAVPAGRLGGLYGLYFAIVALSVGWFGPFFQSLGFSAQQIGIAIGVLTGSKILAPYLWGYLGDHVANRLRVVQTGMVGSIAAAACLLFDFDFLGLCLILGAFGLFWNAIIAQFDTLTLAYLGGAYHRYSQIRVWGSIGFILMMLTSGWWFSEFPFTALPWLMLAGLIASALLSLSLPPLAPQRAEVSSEESVGARLKTPVVLIFFAVAASNQMTHGPLNVFFTLYLQERGYSAFAAGQLWALGVFAEVVLFFMLPRVLSGLDLRILLVVSLTLASLRWIGTAWFVDSLVVLLFLQLLHAFTFGAIHAVSIEFVRRWFPGKLSGRGMALYSGLVFGVGGSIGAFASGYLWSRLGGEQTFLLVGAITAMAAAVAWIFLKEARLEATDPRTRAFG